MFLFLLIVVVLGFMFPLGFVVVAVIVGMFVFLAERGSHI